MTLLTIISRRNRPSLFAEWEVLPDFAVRGRPTTTPIAERYYAFTHKSAVDTSFAVVRGDQPLMLVRCNILGNTLGYFSEPIVVLPRQGIIQNSYDALISAALNEFDLIGLHNGADTVVLQDISSAETKSSVERECVARNGRFEIWQSGLCDLSLSEQQIHSSIRKSFKSLVNWGRRNLTIKYFNLKNPDAVLFESYRSFHAEVAGRVTRSEESWYAMRDWLLLSGGELALAYLESGDLVAGTMTVDGTDTSLYASGVYDRTRFEMPLSHFPVYDAIMRSRSRGMTCFDLGPLPEKGAVSDKEYNIGFFKRGFATSIGMHNIWTYQVAIDPRSAT